MSVNSDIGVRAILEPGIPVQRRSAAARERSAGSEGALNIGITIIVFLALHIPIGFLVSGSNLLAVAHAVATFAVGLYVALFDRRLERSAYVGAYIVGSEVLWHMTKAPIYWESGKYSVAAIFILAMIVRRRAKAPVLSVLYFLLLIPSVWITVMEEPWTTKSQEINGAYDMISFNISGPLALMASAWFFSHLKLSSAQLQRVFLGVIGPVISIATIVLFKVSTSDIEFGTSSNAAASGGFGPNQVSSILGLGALLAFLFYILSNSSNENRKAPIVGVWGWVRRFLMILLMVVLIAQSALTLSRGGLYNAGAGLLLAFFYLVRRNKSRLQFILVVISLVVFSTFILLPRLDEFTGGALLSRFENTNTTGRDDFIQYQIQVFEKHMMFGLGPGRGVWGVTHTEYTRLLSEHGLLGAIALLILLIMAGLNLRHARTILNKAMVASLLAWSFAFMGNVGMRLVAPSFLIGLTFATLILQDDKTVKALGKRVFKKAADTHIPLPIFASVKSVENP